MRWLFLSLLMMLAACSGTLDRPKDLLPEDEMAGILAELALGDQMGMLNQSGSIQANTAFILKKYKATPAQISSSYKYYLSSPGKIEKILDGAQQAIKDKDPEAAAYIEKMRKSGAASLQIQR